tara:strand:+ start:23749 stop:24888 length:1140 start_codon:yes stop_codon:yes gene_type:complete
MKFLNKLKNNFSILINIINFNNERKKFLFYSENISYRKYAYYIIEVLAKKYPGQIGYVSSDIKDRIDNLNIKNLYIGNGFLMNLFFSIIKIDYLFLTLTDLGNHLIKKTKNVGKYIYYFHAAISTFKSYTNTAFDNYDIILCNSKFQLEEIRKREKDKKLPKKQLIESGYFYFDYLSDKISKKNQARDILIAPSWNYDHRNFINENFIKIVDYLINKKMNVIFRPHPEHFKRSKEILEKIKEKFNNFENFYFDENDENFLSMEKSKCLLTDASGISIEFLILFKRPVLYLFDKDKIHNKDISDFRGLKSIDEIIRDKFGYTFYEKDINDLDSIIEKTNVNFQSKIQYLDTFIKNNFFNFGNTKKKFDLIIENQIIKKNK